MNDPSFLAKLKSSRKLSPSVKEFVFMREDGRPMQFEAGQWVNVEIAPQGKPSFKRAYSLVSLPNDDASFALAVTLIDDGEGSKWLHELQLGESIGVTEPQGFFVRRENLPSLFVGTGTGITPLLSMIREAVYRHEMGIHLLPSMALLLGVRSEEDCIYQDELRELSEKYPQISAYYTLSRPQGPLANPMHLSGYVQLHLRLLYERLNKASEGAKETDVPSQIHMASGPASSPLLVHRFAPHVYICGLQKMVKQVREMIRSEMNLPRQLVHSERYD